MLDFEWDDAKNAINRSKHGWDFSDAVHVFEDPALFEVEDRSLDYGEIRMKAIGMALGRLVTVIYTERGPKLRIISARRATTRERFDYEETSR